VYLEVDHPLTFTIHHVVMEIMQGVVKYIITVQLVVIARAALCSRFACADLAELDAPDYRTITNQDFPDRSESQVPAQSADPL
jgi:hypothetical protein